jgi:hypothetical protein
MVLGEPSLSAITISNSGVTQIASGYVPTSSTVMVVPLLLVIVVLVTMLIFRQWLV